MIATTLLVILCLGAAAANPVDPFDDRIVGGTEAAPAQFPYIISLRTPSGNHNCGGSIIHESWVITAAHCVAGASGSSLTVVAGTNQLNDTSAPRFDVSKIIVHPGYDAGTIKDDLALLQLVRPVEISNTIQIIKLQDTDFDDVRKACVAGWGRLGASAPIPNSLQYLDTKTTLINDCKSSFIGIHEVFLTQICAHTKFGEGACFGDSGGPLIYTDTSNQPNLVGLVSWGLPCARDKPDVYTRVASYFEWITENINYVE